VPCTMM